MARGRKPKAKQVDLPEVEPVVETSVETVEEPCVEEVLEVSEVLEEVTPEVIVDVPGPGKLVVLARLGRKAVALEGVKVDVNGREFVRVFHEGCTHLLHEVDGFYVV